MATVVVEPLRRRGIILNCHPAGLAKLVNDDVSTISGKFNQADAAADDGCTLVIGASGTYGLPAAVVERFGYGGRVICVWHSQPPAEGKLGRANWYRMAEMHRLDLETGSPRLLSIHGDCFSSETRAAVLRAIAQGGHKVTKVIYCVAASTRTHPETDQKFSAVIKPIGKSCAIKTVDLAGLAVKDLEIQPATDNEIADTIAVMGGDDLNLWIDALLGSGLIEREAHVVALTYLGPEVTKGVYGDGTIGQAKRDLEVRCRAINLRLMDEVQGWCVAAATQAMPSLASLAIPGIIPYLSILHDAMGGQTWETPLVQMLRLRAGFFTRRGTDHLEELDDAGLVRLDNFEMDALVQDKVQQRWEGFTTDSLAKDSDFHWLLHEIEKLSGFGVDGIDYTAPTETAVAIDPSRIIYVS